MKVDVDVVIFGGGVAGLWLLDALRRRGAAAVVLGNGRLGSGQTISSQGILHGGLKYTLAGRLSGSARAIRDMPDLWRRCLASEVEPHLSATRLRASHCHLWRSGSWSGLAGMIGARIGLRVAPVELPAGQRPEPLRDVPGAVYRLDEQVLCPRSLLENLAARNPGAVWAVDTERGCELSVTGDRVANIHLDGDIELRPRYIVLTAGEGNAALRRRLGLTDSVMQRRPLHMVMVRGELPLINGHCVEGSRTRVTITSDRDTAGRVVWQVGGQLAEEGVDMDHPDLLRHARRELEACLPGVTFEGAAWSSYRVNRAEQATPGGGRPEEVGLIVEGNILTAWPTKLVLAPHLADRIIDHLDLSSSAGDAGLIRSMNRATPDVAALPWDWELQWNTDN